LVLAWHVFFVRFGFGAFSPRVVGIPRPVKTAATGPGLDQHAITPGIWGAVRDAVLHDVRVDAGPESSCHTYALGSLHDFLNAEVLDSWARPMHQSHNYPDLIRDFDLNCWGCLQCAPPSLPSSSYINVVYKQTIMFLTATI
jgi:hypothetical protein